MSDNQSGITNVYGINTNVYGIITNVYRFITLVLQKYYKLTYTSK